MSTQLFDENVLSENTLAAIVETSSRAAPIFEAFGIDYYCDGQRTLEDACADAGLSLTSVTEALAGSDGGQANRSADQTDEKQSLTQLVNDVEREHATLKNALNEVLSLSAVAAQSCARENPRFVQIQQVLASLSDEFLTHLEVEEQTLFPLIRQLEAGTVDESFHCCTLYDPIRDLGAEHRSFGDALEQIRELAKAGDQSGNAPNACQDFLRGLADFEARLHVHLHKENNLLFPRAIAFMQEG